MAERPLTQEMLDRRSYGQGSRARFDPQWAMSRPEKWYTQSYDTGKSKIRNIDLIKDTLVRQPAVTTDPNESRNMYQMLMNQIKGGGGARLIDTSGLPAGARRTGRTLFTDPAKSQGFFGDVGSLFTGRNKAAVRAKEYNPFPNFGQQGKDWYKDQFPGASGLSGIMRAAENFIPYAGMVKRMFSKEREPLERDPRFLPENNMAPFWELLEDEAEDTPLIEDEITEDIPLESAISYEDPDLVNDRLYGEPFDDITEKIVQEDVDEPTISEIFEDPEIFNNVFALWTPFGDPSDFPEMFGGATNAYELYKQLAEQFKEMSNDEIVQKMIEEQMILDLTKEIE